MALRPHLWAMDEAPTTNPTATLILIALADEANDEGEAAAPYIKKLMKRGRCSKRSVQNHLRDLFQARLINVGDQAVAMRRYGKKPGEAPRCWDLNMEATHENVPMPRTEAEMVAEYDSNIGKAPVRRNAAEDDHERQGVQILHPSDGGDETAAQAREVQNLHPMSDDKGVQPAAPGGCSHLHPGGAASCTLPVFDLSSPEKHPPLPPEITAPAPETSEPSEGGDDFSPNEKNLLNAAVEQAVSLRSGRTGWSQQQIVDAMQAQLAEGHAVARVAAVIVDAARDTEGTRSPGRIGYLLTVAAAKAARPAGPVESYRGPLAPGTARCGTHRSEPAIGCGPCKADAIASRLDEPEPALRPEESEDLPEGERLTGRALARKMAAEARTGAAVRISRHEPFIPPGHEKSEPPFAHRLFAVEDVVEVEAAESAA